VSRGEGEIRLDFGRTWCDAVALVQHVKNGWWTEALALYRGELLEGLFPEGVAQEFEEWLAEKRKNLREQAALSAWECSRIEEERGDRKAAAVMARRALDLSPDDEDGVRRLIALLDRHGDRGGALRVYSEWQARLLAEYNVEPAPETRKLARKVQAARKGESHETPPTQQFLVAALLGALARGGASTPSVSTASVAVIPLRAIGDVALTGTAESIAEELTTALAMAPGLPVRSASRSRGRQRSEARISTVSVSDLASPTSWMGAFRGVRGGSASPFGWSGPGTAWRSGLAPTIPRALTRFPSPSRSQPMPPERSEARYSRGALGWTL